MGINPSAFTTQAIADNTEVTLELLPQRPTDSTVISPAKQPGRVFGYYNPGANVVELYVVNASGLGYVRVG
jgi:hypothetical protein